MTDPFALAPSGRPDPVQLMCNLGLDPDPWQKEFLESDHPQVLLNCCRQAGKSSVAAVLALVEAVGAPFTNIVLVSSSQRQSNILYRILLNFYRQLGNPMRERQTAEELFLTNYSRIVSLPCRQDTIRGYSNVRLLIIDEAALVPDDVYRAVRPMLAVSKGRLICMSTPFGRRGHFYRNWAKGGDEWQRFEVPATMIPRIGADFLENERRAGVDESTIRQEYLCSFEAFEGLVYPDFKRCVVPGPAPAGRMVGGLDFGLRNPFAAIWGVVDRDDVLWLTGEHYAREKSLRYHADHMSRKNILWYADPEGAREIEELRCAGFKIVPADNSVRMGIAAVRARIEHGLLKIVEGACPNLLYESELYRYDPEASEGSERPLKENDHALDALRYLVSELDRRRMARRREPRPGDGPSPAEPPGPAPEQAPKPERPWLHWTNDALYSQPWIIPREDLDEMMRRAAESPARRREGEKGR